MYRPLWFNSWYDVSIGPNMALYSHARENGNDAEVRNNQFAVIAPVEHCKFWGLKEETIVGERDMGDTRFDVTGEIYTFFDRFLPGGSGTVTGHYAEGPLLHNGSESLERGE